MLQCFDVIQKPFQFLNQQLILTFPFAPLLIRELVVVKWRIYTTSKLILNI